MDDEQSKEYATARKDISNAYRSNYALAFLFIGLGTFILIANSQLANSQSSITQKDLYLIVGILSLIAGALFAVMGFFIQRRSITGAIVALVFSVINFLMGIYAISEGRPPAGIIILALLIKVNWSGYQGIKKLNELSIS